MSIKPVTYQGVTNFKANLYALEVKSRFIDQSAADGYYKGYGDELNAIVSSNVITVGSGALLVQGRLNEIEPGGEAVTVPIQNGYYGYIVARIETYHAADYNNCTLVAKTGTSLAAISLAKDDTYQRAAESQNKAYEVPLYSFYMTGGAITNLTKLIQPVEESTRTREIANAALAKIEEAYAAIEEMLAQSYVESAGTAKSADEAGSLSTKLFYSATSSNASRITIALKNQKAYVITCYVSYVLHSMVLLCLGTGNTVNSTQSGFYGYYCTYDGNSNTLIFKNGEGNECNVERIYIREL